MALVLQDRVKENSLSSGTGTLTLAGAYTGYRTFSSCLSNADTTYYCIHNLAPGYQDEWEVGLGTYNSDTLARTTILSSSAGGTTKVNFTSGSGGLEVFITYPSEKGVWLDANGDVVQYNFTSINVTGTATINVATLISGTISTTPTNDTEIANKLYVDTKAATGIDVHPAVQCDADGDVAGTYTNGGTTPTWTDITSNSILATGSAHSLSVNDVIVFSSTTNGITAGTAYFVESTPSTTQITISLNYDGSPITTLTNGSGLSIGSRVNSGVGATLESTTNTPFPTDEGYALQAGERILLLGQTNGYENGVYYLSQQGSGSQHWILTRATDADKFTPSSSTGLDAGAYFLVENGTDAGESYVLGTTGTIVFGTTDLVFGEFSRIPAYTAGTGLNLNTFQFSIADTGVTAQTYGNASQVSQIVFNAQGQATSASNVAIAITASNVSGLAASATTDTTNASNITSGTLVNARTSASSSNGASTIVARDVGGNFSANTITANLTGDVTGNTSGSAGSLSTSQNIGISGGVTASNVSFNGTAGVDLNVTAINASVINTGTIGNAYTSASSANGANTIVLRDATGNFTANNISATNIIASGASLTSLNASAINSGTIGNAYTTGSSANGASTLVLRDTSGNFSAGTISATFSGDGSFLTSLNGSAISSGTIANARTTASSSNGASTIIARDANGSFTANVATLTTVTGDGSGVTAINASNISSGTIANARTSGSSSNGASTLVLRDASGDFTAHNVTATGFSGSGASLTSLNGTAITTGTVDNARTSASSSNGASTIVLRDASGNFSAGTITAALTGTASTATAVANALTAGTGITYSSGTTYNGSAAITISIPQAVGTASNVQFGSFGVGTAASGTSGEIRATNNVTAYYSDERLKTRLGIIDNALAKLKSLEGFYYEANETAQALGYEVKKEVGVSAQQVQAVMPEVVAPAPIDEKYLTVRYERLVPLLIEAIKELELQVAELKKGR